MATLSNISKSSSVPKQVASGDISAEKHNAYNAQRISGGKIQSADILSGSVQNPFTSTELSMQGKEARETPTVLSKINQQSQIGSPQPIQQPVEGQQPQTVVPELGTKEYTDYLVERGKNLGVQIPATFQKGGTNLSQDFQQRHQAAKEAGYQAPTDTSGAVEMLSKFPSTQQQPNEIDTFVSQDPYLNSVIGAFQQYMGQQNQRASLVDEYKSLLKESGIQEIDTNLLNMKNVIEGTEDDIRTEVMKAGGFATDSQVIALSNARNKQLIKNYNTLLETRNSKEKYLDNMMDLTALDRQEADKRFETMTNFGLKISELNQTMKKNATDTLDRVAKTIGWDGVLESTQNDPQTVAMIERTYGLPEGSLGIAAQRSKETRTLESQEKQLVIQLKTEQIKTEQAQRAKTIADTQKIINEQKGSILDPKTPEGAKQLATMQGQVVQIGNILNSASLNNAVGTNILSRTPETKKGFWGGLGDILTGGGIRRATNPGLSNFIGDVEQLRSQLNLQSLIDAKSKGATFGALSDQELQVLSNSATKIGVWTIKDANGNVAGYNAKQSDFKKEIDKINNFAKLDYVYRGGTPENVGVQVIDGKYYTKNSDGSVTEL